MRQEIAAGMAASITHEFELSGGRNVMRFPTHKPDEMYFTKAVLLRHVFSGFDDAVAIRQTTDGLCLAVRNTVSQINARRRDISMGSFANSVHVRCANDRTVLAAVVDIMLSAGYRVTGEPSVDADLSSYDPRLRAIRISAERNGWCGLLDSDFAAAIPLACELSRRLDTNALHVMVMGSSSWQYQLFGGGLQLDDFCSAGESGSESENITGLANCTDILAEGVLQTLQQSYESRLRDLERKFEESMPSDILAVHRKVQDGTANQEEMKRYDKWGAAHSRQIMKGIDEALVGALPMPGAQHTIPKEDLQIHIERLRQILLSSVSAERIFRILGKQSAYAENVLADFLELIGVQPLFASLSYQYVEDFCETDLVDQEIRLVEHLKFRKESP